MPSRKAKEPSTQYQTKPQSPFDIKERTFLFSVRVVKLVRQLPRNVAGLEIGRQLIRAGTSVGANVEEAQSGESKRDFVHKMGIAVKEARESRYWLRIVKATLIQEAEIDALVQEADELVRILATIINKSKRTL